MRALVASAPDLPFYRATGRECELFEAAYRQNLPLLLKGPTGCGKTRFVAHMAARLGRPLITVACHDDLSAADLTGRHLLIDGETRWLDGPLTRAVREGAICYLDEVVEARKDVTVILHPLTDDRRILPLERTGEQLHAPPEFMLVASYNPGYQSIFKTLKPSTRQRFMALEFGFPPVDTEIEIVARESGLARELCAGLVNLGRRVRALQGQDLDEGVSTRLLIYCAQLVQAGIPIAEAARTTLVVPLTDDADVAAALRELVEHAFG